MSYRFSNNYNTVLVAPIGDTDTTIRVADSSGLPDTSTGNTFTLTLESADGLKLEIVLATDVTGDTITVTRAQENTLALSFAINDNVTLRLTAGALNNFSQNDHNHTGVYSPVGHAHVWADISDPPATYPPSSHNHAWADITDPPATYAPSAHTHVEADVADLDKYTQAEVDAAIATRVGYGADNTVAGAKISVVSAMPGTPESDVIYFVTG